MKNKYFILFLLSSCFLYCGCIATATLDGIGPSNTFLNKSKIKVGLYIPPDIKNRSTTVKPYTVECWVYSARILTGDGYSTAIHRGLSSCIENVQLSDNPISPEVAKREGFDLYIIPEIINEKATIGVRPRFFYPELNTIFQTSISLKFFNTSGELISAYTIHGAGLKTKECHCSDMAEVMKISMENGLRQVADNIQSVYVAQIKDSIKSK